MRIHRVFEGRLHDASDWGRELDKASASGATILWVTSIDLARIAATRSVDFSRLPLPVILETKCGETPPSSKFLEALGLKPEFVDHVWSADGEEDELPSVGKIILRPRRRLSARRLATSLREVRGENLFFEFLPWSARHPERFTVAEIRSLLQALRERRPDLSPRGYPGLETWDDRIDTRLELEATDYFVFAKRECSSRKPLISVVVPTFNNGLFLRSVWSALMRQTLPREDFEIIVIDDGSVDDTSETLSRRMAEGPAINATLAYFPRRAARRVGDDHYRAGIARNLGARLARGEWLLFLDSDILVPEDFLEKLRPVLGTHDVIQCERYHIRPEFCRREVAYAEIDFKSQVFVEDAPYWGPFFACRDWAALPHFWKYTCTYALALRKDDFVSVGRFKRNFTTYGFEDVDLGYELAKRGKRFHLHHARTLHLTPDQSRSEYGHSRWRRHRLLAKTAKTFYRQHLDPQIFDLLGNLMWEPPLWSRFLRWISVPIQRDHG